MEILFISCVTIWSVFQNLVTYIKLTIKTSCINDLLCTHVGGFSYVDIIYVLKASNLML